MPLVTLPCDHEASSTSLGNFLRVRIADVFATGMRSELKWCKNDTFRAAERYTKSDPTNLKPYNYAGDYY